MTEEQIKYRASQGEVKTSKYMELAMKVYGKLADENQDFNKLNDDDKLLKAFEVTDSILEENHKKR